MAQITNREAWQKGYADGFAGRNSRPDYPLVGLAGSYRLGYEAGYKRRKEPKGPRKNAARVFNPTIAGVKGELWQVDKDIAELQTDPFYRETAGRRAYRLKWLAYHRRQRRQLEQLLKGLERAAARRNNGIVEAAAGLQALEYIGAKAKRGGLGRKPKYNPAGFGTLVAQVAPYTHETAKPGEYKVTVWRIRGGKRFFSAATVHPSEAVARAYIKKKGLKVENPSEAEEARSLERAYNLGYKDGAHKQDGKPDKWNPYFTGTEVYGWYNNGFRNGERDARRSKKNPAGYGELVLIRIEHERPSGKGWAVYDKYENANGIPERKLAEAAATARDLGKRFNYQTRLYIKRQGKPAATSYQNPRAKGSRDALGVWHAEKPGKEYGLFLNNRLYTNYGVDKQGAEASKKLHQDTDRKAGVKNQQWTVKPLKKQNPTPNDYRRIAQHAQTEHLKALQQYGRGSAEEKAAGAIWRAASRKAARVTKPENTKKLRQMRKRFNPSVTDLSRTFQGEADGALDRLYAADGAPANLARAGKLIFLKVQGRTFRIPGAVVAIAPNEKLWITGKPPMFATKARKGEGLDVGEVTHICYETAKAHIEGGKTVEYVHEFGEEGGRRPRLIIDHEGMPILRGGDYKIRTEGIVD